MSVSRITFRASKELKEALKAAAAKGEWTVSYFIVRTLSRALLGKRKLDKPAKD